MQPCFEALIAPRLKGGESVLISAHGNSLRRAPGQDPVWASVMAISSKSRWPTGNPLLIELDGLNACIGALSR